MHAVLASHPGGRVIATCIPLYYNEILVGSLVTFSLFVRRCACRCIRPVRYSNSCHPVATLCSTTSTGSVNLTLPTARITSSSVPLWFAAPVATTAPPPASPPPPPPPSPPSSLPALPTSPTPPLPNLWPPPATSPRPLLRVCHPTAASSPSCVLSPSSHLCGMGRSTADKLVLDRCRSSQPSSCCCGPCVPCAPCACCCCWPLGCKEPCLEKGPLAAVPLGNSAADP